MKFIVVSCIVFFVAVSAFAGPAQPLSSLQFESPLPLNSGPIWDPDSMHGQWFFELGSGTNSSCLWEFYDDTNPTSSIVGVVTNVVYGPGGMGIYSFDLWVTISNDLPGNVPALASSNSHHEVQSTNAPSFSGTMRDVKVSAEFAVVDFMTLPPQFTPPYYADISLTLPTNTYCIEALNETHQAWYCWTPGSPNDPPGDFYVPAWYVGDIPPGQSRSVLMSFTITEVGSGVPALMLYNDPRAGAIRASDNLGLDICFNRKVSLKISEWIETILVDAGIATFSYNWFYEEIDPEEVISWSDVSVFFNSCPTNDGSLGIATGFDINNGNKFYADLTVEIWNSVDHIIEYTHALSTNTLWSLCTTLTPTGTLPEQVIWRDDGSIVTNPTADEATNRFYRISTPL